MKETNLNSKENKTSFVYLKMFKKKLNPFLIISLSFVFSLFLVFVTNSNLYNDISKPLYSLSLYAHLNDQSLKNIYIQEGIRREEIISLLSKKMNWSDSDKKFFTENYKICPLTSKEGYFFPGSYDFPPNTNALAVKETMYQKFNEENKDLFSKIDSEGKYSLDEIVTIASLIQREAGSKNDMALIAGVIYNRLEKNIPLQIDATLQYVKGTEKKWWPPVRSKDKKIDSPYNTYQNEGLPPGPIANPGKAALAAAISPIETDCIYYIHDKNKQIHCSKTYEGHLKNINRYLKGW